MSEARFRAAAIAIAAVFLLGVGALIGGPARGIRSDIDEMQRDLGTSEELIGKQVALTARMIEVGDRQLRIAERQLRIAERQLEISEEALELTRQLVDDVAGQSGSIERIDEIVETALQLRNIAAQTLQQAREINEKTPEGGRALP